MYGGSWAIDDLYTFTVNTHSPTTNGESDADAAPSYRVYEDETGTAILTGTMALLDDTNTVGQYSEQITLSAASGFERGKSYRVRIRAVVGGVAAVTEREFQVGASVNVKWVAGVLADSIPSDLVRTGTCQSGSAAGTIVLDSGASATDDYYNRYTAAITSGTGAGQDGREILDYDGATRTATVTPNWSITPDATSVFTVRWVGPSKNEVADQVWDEILSGHLISGSAARVLNLSVTGVVVSGMVNDCITENSIHPSTRFRSNVLQMNGDTTSIDRLQRGVKGITMGTVGVGSTTTSIVTSSLNPAAAATGQMAGRVLTFAEDTTTINLRNQSTPISSNTSGGVLAVVALTDAPVSGDSFAIS